MSIRDLNLPPGEWGNVDARDTHPVPGEAERPYPPIAPPGDAIYGGAVPAIPADQTGAGGSLEGDVTKGSDGPQARPPSEDNFDMSDEALLRSR